jgi:DNA-directed RNA polymerase subunit N (RpoN/RPB10)
MLTRACSRLRILCMSVGLQTKREYYVYKQSCHRTFTYPKIFRELRIKCTLQQCWKCGSEIQDSSLFCNQCNTLQKPDERKNYFDVLGIEQRYEVENKELTTKYRELQNILHPDRFNAKNVVRCSNLKSCLYPTIGLLD